MIIKETPNKTGLSSIKITKSSILKVSFSKIIDDNNFGLPMPSDEKVNNAKKIQKIIIYKILILTEYLMHVDLPIRAKGSGCF